VKKLLFAALPLFLALLHPKAASAACSSLPNVFVSTSKLSWDTTNANNEDLYACATNVDNTQIGTAGIFPSQIKPTNATQATVGGTTAIRFPNGIVANTKNAYNAQQLGAVCDGTTDNTTWLNALLAMSSLGGTVYFPSAGCTGAYYFAGAIVLPTAGNPQPLMPPIRFTGDGAAWNGYWGALSNGNSVLNLAYTGGDGLHPGKIDARGAGVFELDHLTLEDTGASNFLFLHTTNTTLQIHDAAFIGNPANSRTAVQQDAIQLGDNGYTATSASMTNGSPTLTVGSGDPHFSSSSVGWNVNVAGANGGGQLSTTIASYISPTQVTLANAATTTVSGVTANYLPTQTTDPKAPFQGYGTVIARNFYSHIRAHVVFGTYANNVVVEDETSDTSSGSNLSTGAPYYFDATTDVQVGDIIRGGTIEMPGYPYLVSIQGDSLQNSFQNIGAYDDGSTTLGYFYFGSSSQSVYNTVWQGWYDTALASTYLAGPGAGNNTLISNGQGSGKSVFASPTTFSNGVSSPTVSSTSSFKADTGNANGLGLDIAGAHVLQSDGGGNNVNLYLKTPANNGVLNVYNGTGGYTDVHAANYYGTGLVINGASITTAAGAPTGSCTNGSLRVRTDGGAGSTIYACYASAWHAASTP